MGIFHLFSRLICSTVKIKYLILGYIFPDLLSVFVLKVFHLVLAFATFQIKRKKAESWSVSEFQSNLLNRAAISSGRSCSLNLIRVRVTWQLLFRSTVFRKFFRAPVHTSHHHCYEYSQYIKCNVIHHWHCWFIFNYIMYHMIFACNKLEMHRGSTAAPYCTVLYLFNINLNFSDFRRTSVADGQVHPVQLTHQ